jgi:hypothetical protein
VTVTRISDRGELGRRTDGGRQGATRFGDKGRIPGTGEARMSTERKGEERRKARGKLHRRRASSSRRCPGGRSPKGDGACTRMGGAECEQVRKGRVRDDARLLYRQRGEKGKRGRGWRPAHLPLMAGSAAAKRTKGKGKQKGFGGETGVGITALD